MISFYEWSTKSQKKLDVPLVDARQEKGVLIFETWLKILQQQQQCGERARCSSISCRHAAESAGTENVPYADSSTIFSAHSYNLAFFCFVFKENKLMEIRKRFAKTKKCLYRPKILWSDCVFLFFRSHTTEKAFLVGTAGKFAPVADIGLVT